METFELFRADEEYSKREFRSTEHEFRSKFERDRDRILYSKEFRRLSGKTQVFIAGFDDHLRTRLTHTLEVSQIARTISNSLSLNQILTEAIALGHDLGHTPFGHVGERTLNLLMNGCDNFKDFNIDLPTSKRGFKHNWQSLRVVSFLETISPEFPGLNLTDYTKWGILNHSNLKYKKCDYFSKKNICTLRHINADCKNPPPHFSLKFYEQYINDLSDYSWSVEGVIVRWADEIAQRNHDIEDALYSGLLDKNDMLDIITSIFERLFTSEEQKKIRRLKDEDEITLFLPALSSFIVNFYVTNIITQIKESLRKIAKEYKIKNNNDFHLSKKNIIEDEAIEKKISLSDEFLSKDKKLQHYLYSRILNSHVTQSHDGKSNFIIRHLIKAYLTNPQQLPDSTIIYLYRNYKDFDYFAERTKKSRSGIVGDLRSDLNKDHNIKNELPYRVALLRTICDYIAGMTDKFALEQYEKLYGGTAFRKV